MSLALLRAAPHSRTAVPGALELRSPLQPPVPPRGGRPQQCPAKEAAPLAAAATHPGSRLGFDLLPQLASSLARPGSEAADVPVLRSSSGAGTQTSTSGREFLDFPAREGAQGRGQPPLIRVRLAVPYRVHSRQMLCIGGSQIPFGWSFLSIAKVPMSWHPDDVWVAEVSSSSQRLPSRLPGEQACQSAAVQIELPPKSRIEYKYVILEEQVRLCWAAPGCSAQQLLSAGAGRQPGRPAGLDQAGEHGCRGCGHLLVQDPAGRAARREDHSEADGHRRLAAGRQSCVHHALRSAHGGFPAGHLLQEP